MTHYYLFFELQQPLNYISLRDDCRKIELKVTRDEHNKTFVADTRGQNAAVNVNGGDANDCSGGKRPKIKSCSSAGEEAHSDDKIWLQDSLAIYSEPYPGEGSVDAIYDEPDVAARDSANALHGNDKNSEPVYMLYEPFHP